MCSLALVVGLVENIYAVEQFAQRHPYDFWLAIAEAAEHAPFDSWVQGVYIPTLAHETLALARDGLVRRGYGEEKFLGNLAQRIGDKRSHSERMIALRNAEGIEAVLEELRYRFDE